MRSVGAALSFLWKTDHAGPHLWFVLSDPDPETSQVVVVRLVTSRSYTDKTVALAVGDHPFVQHASNVDCGSARLLKADVLEAFLKNGTAALQADMSVDLLTAVRAGVLASSHTVHFVARYCRARW